MAKKQTRRSVSIRGTTYDRIRDFCEREGLSMSEFVEARISTFFDGTAPAPAKAKPLPKPPAPAPKTVRAKPPGASVKAPSVKAPPVEAPPKKVAKAKSNGNGNGNGNGEEELSFDELQDAARFFTF